MGLADNSHCCTGAVDRAWSGKRSAATNMAVAKSRAGGDGAKSSSAAGSAPTAMQESGANHGSDSEASNSESSSGISSISSSSRSISQSSKERAAHTIHVPLSVGPGFAGISGALTTVMMGYQASLKASPKTRLRSSMSKWAHICRRMFKFFSRSINRTLLVHK